MDPKQVKNILIISLGILFVVVLSAFTIRLLFSGNEDDWICQNGQWVKHGNPSGPPPSSGCEEKPVQSPIPSQQIIGGDKDDHGCLIAAGYSWCEPKQKCVQVWEEGCDDVTTLMAEIAKATKIEFSGMEEKNVDWLLNTKEKISVEGIKKQADNIEVQNLSILNRYMTEFLDFETDEMNSVKTKTGIVTGFKKSNFVCVVISETSAVDASKINITLSCGKIY